MIRKHGLQVLALMMIALIITSCAQGPVTQVTTTPGKPPAKTRVTSEDLMLVDQLMLNRKFEEAVSKIQELQQIEPGNPALEEKLRQAAGEWKFAEAQNLMAVGAYGEAIKKIKSALDLIPQDQRMLYALDEAYLQLGMQYLSYLDAEKAREALNSVQYDQNMKLQAQSLLTTYVPAVEYTKQGYEALTNGNYTMALGYFKAALQLKPGLEQAANGQKAAEAMAQAQPSPTPGYTPGPGTSQPIGEGQITYPTPTPTEEVSTWEKPEAPSGVQDWSNFKSWMENEINRWMSGSSINENPLLGYQSLSLNEDPQAYNYLSESDFGNTLYLSAIKIYGERALYIKSEIGRLFPLPGSLDISASLTQKRIQRLSRACDFILDGINGLKAPSLFKETHNNLLQLIQTERNILSYAWQNYAFGAPGSTIYAPEGVSKLEVLAQSYLDSFDYAQSKVQLIPFAELPKWAQAKKYYLEASLTGYMLNEVAKDFEDLLPLPQIPSPKERFVQNEAFGGPENKVDLLLAAKLTIVDFSKGFVEYEVNTTVTASGITSQILRLFIPKSFELFSYNGSLDETEENYILWTKTSTALSCSIRAHSELFGKKIDIFSTYGSGTLEQYPLVSVTLYIPEPDPQMILAQKTLDELIRLVRYSENLHYNLSVMNTPEEFSSTSPFLVKAAKELASTLYAIPVWWQQLSGLPEYYFTDYPEYSNTNPDIAPNALSLFDQVTGLVDKDEKSFLTVSGDLAYHFGTPETWKDMIEYLRAQLLQRLAELGYR